MTPGRRDVVDYEEFTGETKAVNNVMIQAQVSGILKKCEFEEGGEVCAGEVLCEIEPELYQAALDTAIGNLGSAKGDLAALQAREPQLKLDRERNEKLVKSGSVSKSDLDIADASLKECLAKIDKAQADIVRAEAEVSRAEINLKYTKILSPIDGYISRKLVTEGNLIQAQSSELAQIVSHDPIYVEFFVDEGTYLKLVDNAGRNAGQNTEGIRKSGLKIEYRLTNEESFVNADGNPLHSGNVDYTDPLMDESSGTILLRATCPNPRQGNGAPNGIIPGMMVHIRIPVTEKYNAVLVPEEALGTEQGTRFIYVVDSEGKAQMRRLVLGPLQEDNMRIVRKGIEPDDTIVVSGLLRLRPGVEVEARETTLEKLREGIN